MEAQYSTEELQIQDTARSLLSKRVTHPARLAAERSVMGYDQSLWREVIDLGWLGIADGDVANLSFLAVLSEEMGRAALATPFHRVVAAALLLAACPEPRAKALHQEVIAGERIIVPLAKSPSKATVSDDRVRLTAPAQVVEWGNIADAFLVAAGDGTGGAVIALIPRESKAVLVEPVKLVDSTAGALITLDEATPAEIIGRVPRAVLEVWRTTAQLLASAEVGAAAAGALMLTAEYAKERIQFGRPIGSFQALQHGMADIRYQVEAAWLAVWEGLSMLRHKQDARGSAALACWLAERALQQAAVAGSQYHGGIGFTENYPFQYFYRKASGTHARLGSQWELLGKIGEAYVMNGTA